MLRNALRKELNTLLDAPSQERAPAVRRSTEAAWLYSSDVPALCGGTVPEALLQTLTRAGWETRQDGSWLQLRKAAPEPPESWFAGPFGPEASCCLSLLDRHPAPDGAAAGAAQRMLIKAGEEGAAAYEEACRILHRGWAERLRKGEPLPAVSRRYFGE